MASTSTTTSRFMVPEWNPGGLSAEHYDASETPWDRVVILGQTIPAIATVDCDKDVRLQVNQTPGQDDANLAHLGLSPAPVTIKLIFLSAEDLQVWSDLRPQLMPNPGKPRPDPVALYHPALALNGIQSLYLKTLGTPKPRPGGGPVEVTTRWVEFLPPKKAGVKTPVGSATMKTAVQVDPALRPTKPSDHPEP